MSGGRGSGESSWAHPPLRYGVAGTRTAGCEHLLALSSLEQLGAARIVAASDPVDVFREWAAECLTGRTDVALHQDHRELLARDDLDAVVVATPHTRRAEVLDDALATDLAVMIEPPTCTSLLECWSLSERAAERWSRRGSLTWVAAGHRHLPPVERFLGAIGAGATGALRSVTIRDHRGPVWPVEESSRRSPTHEGEAERTDRDHQGSAAGDDTCRRHDLLLRWAPTFDLLNAIVGAPPARVMASSVGEGADPADAFLIAEYRNGVRGSLDLSVTAGGSSHDLVLVAVGDDATAEATVPGSTVRIGGHHRAGTLELPVPRDGRWPTRRQTGMCRDHLAFIDTVVGERPTESSVRSGTWAVGLGLAARLSIERGGAVELSELGLH